jgi:DNA polymerase III delta subunit
VYFKGPPWDVLRERPTLIDSDYKGLYTLNSYDPYLEKIALGKIPPHLLADEKLSVLNGKEVTGAWLEDNILTMDFFSTNQSYLVLFAEELPVTAQEILLADEIDWGNRYFILSMTKETKFLAALNKMKNTCAIKIEAPKFWESAKLIQYLCAEMKMKLAHDIQSYLVEVIPPEPGLLIQNLKKIKLLLGPDSRLSLNQIKEVIDEQRIDQFEIANLYGEKKWKELFSKVLEHSDDFEGLIPLFSFLQSHLLKIADTGYMAKKNRLSKYDRTVEAQKALWCSDQVSEELAFLEECETFAKSKSYELVILLRQRLIKSYN